MGVKKGLTAKQNQIYDYILSYTKERGYPPAVREIAAAVHLKSPSTVHFHLKAMEAAGVLNRGVGKTRSITLVAREQTETLLRIPIFQGGGTPFSEPSGETLAFVVKEPQRPHFALRVEQNSMRYAGIFSGDLVVVCQREPQEDGELALVLLEEELTCRRIQWEGDQQWLVSEDPTQGPVNSGAAVILGKIVAVVRRYD